MAEAPEGFVESVRKAVRDELVELGVVKAPEDPVAVAVREALKAHGIEPKDDDKGGDKGTTETGPNETHPFFRQWKDTGS